ncbi:MBL fold metallo-hydrolase [Nocardioides acrostichi]|uniref:MBL fold metallo-hydrolase n=1 Tax=Nocardioides acrostichi TaxID=2784339 RepID=A0A930UXA3_9ACTN|nr:MBL fold metallo-hydrolase [Nocardioides acrostichi]MBF4160094.1 MBL fold metallo-hydrolase [Nocardioides acrostichi]
MGAPGLRLVVVGCSGSYPGPDSPASCYLLEAEHDDGSGSRTWRVLLDLGSGALGALHHHADPRTLDGILLSHLHADHCLDLCGLYVLLKYHPDGPAPRIPVWGPAGTDDRLARAYGLDPASGMHEEMAFRTWPDRPASQPVRIGPFEIDAIPVDHPVEAYGIRVTVGARTVAYSGDTGPCEGLDRLAVGADVLLCEASFREGVDNPPSLHCTGADAARSAQRSGAARLVLTHVPPWYDPADAVREAEPHFTGEILRAVPGLTLTL